MYLGRSDNSSGHIVFKLGTKAVVSANRVVVIPTPVSVTNRVNEMGEDEDQPEGIRFSNRDSRVTINDLDLNMDDDDNDSNASDESFKHDEEYQKEFDNEEKKGDEDLNTDESEEDYFNLSFQQHHALFTDHPKSRSVKSRNVKSRSEFPLKLTDFRFWGCTILEQRDHRYRR